MPRVSVTNVLVAVALLVVGYSCREPGETVVLTRVDTLDYSRFRDSLKAERLESDGLRAKLAGRMRVEPVHIVRTDTLVTPPDTVLQLVRVEGQTLTLAPLIKADTLWAPEIHRYQIGNCDDGWSWAAGELVCDRARLGHLAPFVSAAGLYPLGVRVAAGVEWRPSFRSGWRVSMETDPTGRMALGVTRAWKLW